MLRRTRPGSESFVGFSKNLFFRGVIVCVFVGCIAGCGDFFASKVTELESRNLLRELETVRISPNRDIPLPEIYRQPPRIIESVIGDKKDAKLFYFSRHHTVDKLAALVNEQFMNVKLDAKNKTMYLPDYNVTTNLSTNQMIVRCPSLEDAQQVLKFLDHTDVQPIQIKIDCLISEVYADHTMDWETNLEIQNLFGQEINLVGKLPGAALRDIARSTFGLKAGYENQDAAPGHKFSALVDLLVSRGYLKILMNPQLEVVNGQSATIYTSEHVPIDVIQRVHPVSGVITQQTEYRDVVDSLTITPRVFADGYIGIETHAVIGSKATPEGVKQVPIVTERWIDIKENRIRQGESLIIGGIRKTEQRSVVRGIPFLKDIPIIGVLFSSKDFEERGKEVLFILTPTISTGGIPNEEMVADIQRKHAPVRDSDGIMGGFGSDMYTELVEEEATKAEIRRVKAEMQRTGAERRASALEEKLADAAKQLESEKSRAEKAEADTMAAQLAAEAEKAKADAAVAEKNKSAEDMMKLTEDAKSAQSEAEKSRSEAAAAKAAAEKARRDAEAEIARWMKLAEERNGKQNQQEAGEQPKPEAD